MCVKPRRRRHACRAACRDCRMAAPHPRTLLTAAEARRRHLAPAGPDSAGDGRLPDRERVAPERSSVAGLFIGQGLGVVRRKHKCARGRERRNRRTLRARRPGVLGSVVQTSMPPRSMAPAATPGAKHIGQPRVARQPQPQKRGDCQPKCAATDAASVLWVCALGQGARIDRHATTSCAIASSSASMESNFSVGRMCATKSTATSSP